jgi:hypothetical protein
VLCTKHLNAQHREVHWAIRCIEGEWATRWKDVERFRSHPQGIQWLALVHDMSVHELQRRGRYKSHATPGPELEPMYADIFWLWSKGGMYSYLPAVETFGYPRTRLNQGTPWERDSVSFAWYRSHENDWTRALAREASGC